MTQFVTKDALKKMVTLQKGYMDSNLLEKQPKFTLGKGLQLVNGTLSVTLDTTISKIVESLPAAPATGDENKIHLVLSSTSESGNTYTEYIWVEGKWEELGEFKPDVDLTPYLKVVDLTGTATTTGFYLSKGATKFFEATFTGTDFTGSVNEAGDLTVALKSVIAAKASGFYKFQVDAKGRVVAVTNVTGADIQALGFSTTAAVTQAITAAVAKEETARTTAIQKEAKTRADNDATLTQAVQVANDKIKTLEDAEANRSILTEQETEELYNSIYGA